mmetsp:Transcript_6451/g.13898  ORF Transcript_6451/g.13898 Transcript_6451/m.13898 type:complete len:189 (+) Transcript_6451:173-739(+)
MICTLDKNAVWLVVLVASVLVLLGPLEELAEGASHCTDENVASGSCVTGETMGLLPFLAAVARGIAPDLMMMIGIGAVLNSFSRSTVASLLLQSQIGLRVGSDTECNKEVPSSPKCMEDQENLEAPCPKEPCAKEPSRRRVRRSRRSTRKKKICFDDRVLKSVRFMFEGWPETDGDLLDEDRSEEECE